MWLPDADACPLIPSIVPGVVPRVPSIPRLQQHPFQTNPQPISLDQRIPPPISFGGPLFDA